MAAKTPDSIIQENAGTFKMHIATFSTNDIDDADTWASAIPNVVGFWVNATDDPTQTKEGIDVGESSGTFTFYTGEANRQGMLYVLSRI
jgi:hypothetical protein